MIDREILLKTYEKEELQIKLKEKLDYIKELQMDFKKISDLQYINDNYVVLCYRLLEIACLYELLGDDGNAKKCYEKIIGIREKYPNSNFLEEVAPKAHAFLGKGEKALEMMRKTQKVWYLPLSYAGIYEKMGDIEKAREIYAHEAQEYERTAGKERWHQGPHYFQTASDLWEKAGNSGKAKECNEKAIEIWNERKEEMEKVSSPLRLAWLYEEIGYIYFKAKDFETARKYYDMSEKMYKKAYNKKHLSDSEFIRCDDDDWNKEIYEHFSEVLDIYLFDENSVSWSSNEVDLKRIKYRKLLLEKEMKEKSK